MVYRHAAGTRSRLIISVTCPSIGRIFRENPAPQRLRYASAGGGVRFGPEFRHRPETAFAGLSDARPQQVPNVAKPE